MFRRIHVLSVVILLLFSVFPSALVQADEVLSDVVISELQTTGMRSDGADDGRQEFIELHNQTIIDIDVTGWRVQYFSASREDVFDAAADPTRDIAILDGMISENGYALLSFVSYIEDADIYFGEGSTASSGLLAKTGGHLRLLRSDETIADVAAWGTGKSPETKAIAEIDGGASAVRKISQDSGTLLQDSNDNSVDFEITDVPNPQGGSLYVLEITEELEMIVPPCDGLVISELMPNPDGTDTGKEFIEIYNPTSAAILLEDCELSTSSSKKVYSFPLGSTLGPKEYLVLTDALTGLVLANSAGGHVLLVGTTTEYLVQYPTALEPDRIWAMFDSGWQVTDRPTPGRANELPQPAVEDVDDQEEFAPCPAGKYRNPETNRCRNIQETVAILAPCSLGQVRNPETNRCRSLGAVVASLVPCKEGQERSLETNRCRNTTSTTVPAACQEGYERNPETNRCRKTQQVLAASASVGSGLKDNTNRKLDGFFIAVASFAVVGYGLYEYRRDAGNVIYRMRQRFTRGNTVK